MLESNAPAGQIDSLGLAKAWRRAKYAAIGGAVMVVQEITPIVKDIDLDPILGAFGDTAEKLIALAVAGAVAFLLKLFDQWRTNYAPTETK
ncbi:MAG TPA: hypothetical protein PLZ55_12185 [bacterium]|nr:hypothetical protein [bacterium]